jgi:hypothetical protein
VTTRGVILAALLAALGRPSWWLLALAGFLVRGGLLLFILAIVSLPSPLIVSNIVAPLLVPLALGQFDAGTLAVLGAAVALVATWLIGGAWVAAAIEIVLVRDGRQAMADEGLPVRPAARSRRWLSIRVAVARIIAHVPTVLALGIGSVKIANVAYVELTDPFEVATPLVVRVIAGAGGPIAAIVVIWLLGEIVGGLAARSMILRGASVFGGLRIALRDTVRRPFRTLGPPLVTTLVLAIDLAAMLAAVAFVWTQVQARLIDSLADGPTLAIALLAFGATWIGALALTGLVDAWRSAAQTFEAERAAAADVMRADQAPDHDPIGVSPGRRPGDWSIGGGGDSL